MTTAVAAGIYRDAHTVSMVHAGHPPAFICRRNGLHWRPLRSVRDEGAHENLPLGVEMNTDYVIRTVKVSPGDILFFYTDGVTEAPDRQGRFFGDIRLHELLDTLAGKSPSFINRSVRHALLEHTGGTLNHDDVTILTVAIL